MLQCPGCKSPLIQVPYHQGSRNICPQKHGVAVMLSAFRRWLKNEARPLLDQSLGAARAGKRACPRCQKSMREFRFSNMVLDECGSCGLAWFDAGEFEQSPRRAEAELNREDQGVLSATTEPGYQFRSEISPFENIEGQKEGAPVFTLLLLASMVVVSKMALSHPTAFYVFDADHPFRLLGAPALTSLFVHVNIWHFLGNAFFLFTAGSILETTLGVNALFRIFLVSGIAGDAFFAAKGHGYMVGSGGAITGVLTALVLTQPNGVYVMQTQRYAHFGGFWTTTWRIPIAFWLVCWIAEQVVFAAQHASETPQSYLAYVGGAFGGLACVFFSDLKVLAPPIPLKKRA